MLKVIKSHNVSSLTDTRVHTGITKKYCYIHKTELCLCCHELFKACALILDYQHKNTNKVNILCVCVCVYNSIEQNQAYMRSSSFLHVLNPPSLLYKIYKLKKDKLKLNTFIRKQN